MYTAYQASIMNIEYQASIMYMTNNISGWNAWFLARYENENITIIISLCYDRNRSYIKLADIEIK